MCGPPPIEGADRVARAPGQRGQLAGDVDVVPVWLNGAAARFDLDGELSTVASLVIEDRWITRIYAVRNPQKLAGLGGAAALTR